MPKFVEVQLNNGTVKGLKKTTALGRQYFCFNGIPFMKSPVGKLRFRDPEPVEKWSEPLDCTGPRPSYTGWNRMKMEVDGQEDAGSVSIATPYLDRKLPVVIFIHGGGFQFSYGVVDTKGPDYLLQKDLLFVSLNYRVGPIGFLSLEDPELNVPGNAGLKDQLLALKWVKENIGKFGGDPDNITLMGSSAGGVSCHLLMLCEKAKGLFHRVIAMSGTAFIKSWTFSFKRDITERLAKSLGWNGSGGEKKILEILENAKVEDIVKAETKILTQEEIFKEHILFPFTPVIEPYETRNSILTKDPSELSKTSWSNDIDCIFGVTSLEGALMAVFPSIAKYSELFKTDCFLPKQEVLGKNISEEKLAEYCRKLQQLYFQGEEPSLSNRSQYFLFASDVHFAYGVYRGVLSRINSGGKGKTYFYRFDAKTYLNRLKNSLNLKEDGVCHSDDTGYIFKPYVPREVMKFPEIDSKEYELLNRFSSLLASFVISGDPNEFEEDETFRQTTAGNSFHCLNITNDSFEMVPLPEIERYKVWNEILSDAGVAYF